MLVFIVLYNLVHLGARVWLFSAGYARAEGVVDAVAHAHMSSGTPFLKACGAALAGAIGAVGDRHTLMLDPTWAYQYPEALRVGKAIEELGYYWYEDPLADDDLYNYVKLKQQLSIPILATEYSPGGFTAFAPWLVARATDFLRGDVAVKGGITALVKSAHDCSEGGLAVALAECCFNPEKLFGAEIDLCSRRSLGDATSASFSTPGTILKAKVSLTSWQAPRPGLRRTFRNRRLKKAKWPTAMTSGIES